MTTPTEQIELVRELLNRADERPVIQWTVGDLIIAISHLTDLVEAMLPDTIAPEGEIGKAVLATDPQSEPAFIAARKAAQ